MTERIRDTMIQAGIDPATVRYIEQTARVIVTTPLPYGDKGYEPVTIARTFLEAVCDLRAYYPDHEWVLQAQVTFNNGKTENGLLAIFPVKAIRKLNRGKIGRLKPEKIAEAWRIHNRILNVIRR